MLRQFKFIRFVPKPPEHLPDYLYRLRHFGTALIAEYLLWRTGLFDEQNIIDGGSIPDITDLRGDSEYLHRRQTGQETSYDHRFLSFNCRVGMFRRLLRSIRNDRR